MRSTLPRRSFVVAEALPIRLGPEEGRIALVDGRRRRIVERGVERRRVVQVDPPVPLEVRVERDVLQTLLVVLVDVELRRERLETRVRVVQPHLALPGDV